jgi:hypothetical protein
MGASSRNVNQNTVTLHHNIALFVHARFLETTVRCLKPPRKYPPVIIMVVGSILDGATGFFKWTWGRLSL